MRKRAQGEWQNRARGEQTPTEPPAFEAVCLMDLTRNISAADESGADSEEASDEGLPI
ncbi:hypothetical protein GCM10011393_32760 [Sphingopyxis bauzanensis]|nr:hypothetical protein GCM10011393_32760 [Sphingopyxis bauzanensis]